MSSPSLKPLQAVRRYCVWCCGGRSHEVGNCASQSCPFWAYRKGARPTSDDREAQRDARLLPFERPATGAEFQADGGTTLRAIRRRCLDCSGNSPSAVRHCAYGPSHARPCPLWSFRIGKNPNYASLSEATRAKIGMTWEQQTSSGTECPKSGEYAADPANAPLATGLRQRER